MSDPAPAPATPRAPRVECVIPILRVADLRASLRWYQSTLAFSIDWDSPGMASVSRDGRAIMLSQGDQGHLGGWVWIGVDDIAPLFADLTVRGVPVVLPPTNFSWAYETRIADPDGNVLRFGSDPLPDLPFRDELA